MYLCWCFWALDSLVAHFASSLFLPFLPSTIPGLGQPSMCILDFIENECHICILLKMQIAGFNTLKTFFLVFLKHDFLEEKWEDADYLIMFIWEILVPCFWLFWFSLEFSREQIGQIPWFFTLWAFWSKVFGGFHCRIGMDVGPVNHLPSLSLLWKSCLGIEVRRLWKWNLHPKGIHFAIRRSTGFS